MNRSLVIAGILLAALLLAALHLATTDRELSRDNIGWNGSADFFSRLDRHTTVMVTDISDLAGHKNATFLIIAPGGTYQEDEIRHIREFVLAGNTLLLADESPHGTQLLQDINSRITIGTDTLASIDRAYNDSSVIITSPVGSHPITAGVQNIVLDKAVSLHGGEPLVQSSIMSWIDKNGDLRVSEGESFGRYTVMSRETMGKGEIMVLSDASIFINSMTDIGDNYGNEQFIRGIVTCHPTLLVEQVHSLTAQTTNPGHLVRMIRSDLLMKTGIITVILLLLAFLLGRRPPKTLPLGTQPVKM